MVETRCKVRDNCVKWRRERVKNVEKWLDYCNFIEKSWKKWRTIVLSHIKTHYLDFPQP